MITKEEENPGREGDTREDEGSRNTYQTAPCLRYQAEKEEEEAKNQAKTGMAPTVTRLDIAEKYKAKIMLKHGKNTCTYPAKYPRLPVPPHDPKKEEPSTTETVGGASRVGVEMKHWRNSLDLSPSLPLW